MMPRNWFVYSAFFAFAVKGFSNFYSKQFAQVSVAKGTDKSLAMRVEVLRAELCPGRRGAA